MIKVKICGITSLKDALAAQAAGCDALGFIFYKKSRRFIRPILARDIIRKLPKGIHKVGVFVDAKEKTIKRIAKSSGVDILQFHGKESPEFCRRFKGFRVVKAFRVKDKIDWPQVLKYKTFGYLFDAWVIDSYGGTGKTFNWRLLRGSSHALPQIFLSGGLSRANVKKAITMAKPDWVDVSSGVESRPGEKCHRKVRGFMKAAKGCPRPQIVLR